MAFPTSTGQELKDRGMALVLAVEHEEWKARVREVVREMPHGKEFTVADLQKLVDREPHHPNCWGAIINAMAKSDRLCMGTGRYVKQTRPSCHAAVIQVWVRNSS